MDQNNGIEAKISKKEIRITIMMDLQEIFPHLIKISLPGKTSHMGVTFRTREEQTIYAKVSHSMQTYEIDLEIHLSAFGMETGETMETFLVLHLLQGETFTK